MTTKSTSRKRKHAKHRPKDRGQLVVAANPKKVLAAAMKNADGRERLPKFLANVRMRLTTDLGDDLSTQQQLLVDRTAHVVALLAIDETALASGKTIDAAGYCARINTLIGLLRTLGLERVARKAEGFRQYLAATAKDVTP